MKKAMNMALVIALALLFYGTANAGDPGPARPTQQQRIARGVAAGQLTAHEARALEREQAIIAAKRHRAWADGVMTGRERAGLHRMRQHASRHIYCLRHNDRMRPYGAPHHR